MAEGDIFMFEEETIYFREVQKFRQVWIWTIVVIVSGLAWYGFIEQVIFNKMAGVYKAPNLSLIINCLFCGILLPLFLYTMSLTTEVRSSAIYIRFFPFHRSFCKIPLKALERYEFIAYSPIWEYGGWGIRYSWKGKAYTVSGNLGVRLKLKNGNIILIGSQLPELMVTAIKEALQKKEAKI